MVISQYSHVYHIVTFQIKFKIKPMKFIAFKCYDELAQIDQRADLKRVDTGRFIAKPKMAKPNLQIKRRSSI